MSSSSHCSDAVSGQTNRTTKNTFALYVVVALALFPGILAAAPDAIDDNVLVPSNTTVFANDLAANDTFEIIGHN